MDTTIQQSQGQTTTFAPPSAALAPSANRAALDAFVRGLHYDPQQVIVRSREGTATSVGRSVQRATSGNRVLLTTTTRQSLDRALSDVAILRPTSGVVFPGALVLADTNLANGTPTPIAVARGPVTISVDLPGLRDAKRTVDAPTNSSVQDALNQLIEAFLSTPDAQRYSLAARSNTQVTRVYSSEQASLALGFSAKWAQGSASANLTGSTSSERLAVTAFYRQVFYTVSMDTPDSPGAVFGPDVTPEQLAALVSNDAPPAYVRSVDYGRLVMIRMEVSKQAASVDLEAALNAVTASGTEVGGDVKARYQAAFESATFSVVAIGGGVEQAAKFTGSAADLDRLAAFIQGGAVLSRDNPGAPISYNVAFLRDNALATMRFSADWTTSETTEVPSAYIKLEHAGGYVARFNVSWSVPNADATGYVPGAGFRSGEVTAGWTHTVDMPGDARDVRIHAEAKTLLAWDPWGEIINLTLGAPSNKTYRVSGTTLNRHYQEK